MTGDLRRSQLLAAAVRVFARNGFKGTKTREIAAEAGVNEALLFRHFPTKDDVYAAILQQKADESRTEDILKSLRTHANNRDDRAYFEEFAAHLLSCLGDNPDFLRLILFSALEHHQLANSFREKQVKPLYNAVSKYIAMRQKEGALRAIRPAVAVRALMGMLAHHVLTVEVYGQMHPAVSSTEAVTGFTSIFLEGLKHHGE